MLGCETGADPGTVSTGRQLAALVEAGRRNRDRLAERGRALPGAAACLERLAGDAGVIQSVLTGNVEPNARVKLEVFGTGPPSSDKRARLRDHRTRNRTDGRHCHPARRHTTIRVDRHQPRTARLRAGHSQLNRGTATLARPIRSRQDCGAGCGQLFGNRPATLRLHPTSRPAGGVTSPRPHFDDQPIFWSEERQSTVSAANPQDTSAASAVDGRGRRPNTPSRVRPRPQPQIDASPVPVKAQEGR
jgi:hypothetical protein